MTAVSLRSCRVLVTRPALQAQNLLESVSSAGGVAISYPALAIAAATESGNASRCTQANSYDWLIFISRNAIEYALPHLPNATALTKVKIAAIGEATANAIQAAGYQVDLIPKNASNSEALLNEEALNDCKDHRILIVRGVGGRDLLLNRLASRGAKVEYAEVYARICPEFEPTSLPAHYIEGIDIITVASGETLRNLLSMATESNLLEKVLNTPLLVVSERIQNIAQRLGFADTIIVSESPSDQGIIEAIDHWWQQASREK